MTSRQILITLVYTVTVFASALLLFVIQPMAGKLVLPLLGGSSAVWTTSMLFFQVILLAGYVYAHGIAQNFSFSVQVGFHVLVVGTAILFLPAGVPEYLLRTGGSPAVSLIVAFLVGIGPPTFVVSSSAPLLQHWFGGLRHPDADDPYYLYAASNAGSLIALLSYPFLIERFLTLETQQTGWSAGFLVLALLTGFCGLAVFTSGRESDRSKPEHPVPSLPLSRRAWWVLITFIPSSLMLGVTHYLTTDLASVPLLWVIPLAAYLLSFILVFARLEHPLWLYRLVLPPALFVVFAVTFGEFLSMAFLIVLHVGVFFVVALYFHGRLAQDRPDVSHLTGYYICMALGGSLGGVFNALIAPLIFDRLVEYFLVMALALVLVLRPSPEETTERGWRKWGPYLLGIVACGYFFWTIPLYVPVWSAEMASTAAILATIIILIMAFRYPTPSAAALGVLLLLGFVFQEDRSGTILRERSFYGQYEVSEEEGDVRTFRHGTTLHGKQRMEDGKLLDIPTGYYHPKGPFGDLFRNISVDRVGIAGLGTGGIAPYRKEGDEFHFFEIDPLVERIARSKFGYLEACGSSCQVHIGDARQLIEKRPSGSFDLLIMDAYTSDAIPTHLLTKEAVQLYLSRVKPEGVVALHISNRHFNLERVVGAIAGEIDATARVKTFVPDFESIIPSPLDLVDAGLGKKTSRFPRVRDEGASSVKLAVVARNEEVLAPFEGENGWKPPAGKPLLWTDSYSNIVPLLTE